VVDGGRLVQRLHCSRGVTPNGLACVQALHGTARPLHYEADAHAMALRVERVAMNAHTVLVLLPLCSSDVVSPTMSTGITSEGVCHGCMPCS
jgi:hypothetical protein